MHPNGDSHSTLVSSPFSLKRAAGRSGSSADNSVSQLQILLGGLFEIRGMESKLAWLRQLSIWLSDSHAKIPTAFEAHDSKESHLRFFLRAMKDFPTARSLFVQVLFDCLTQTQAMSLFALSGLNPDSVSDALRDRVLKRDAEKDPSREKRLGDVLLALFPSKEFAVWLTQLPAELVIELLQLVYFVDDDLGPDQKNPWKTVRLDLIESMSVVSAKILATAFTGAMEIEESQQKLRTSPFLALEHSCEALHNALRQGDRVTQDQLGSLAESVTGQIQLCREHISETAKSMPRKPFLTRGSANSQWGFVKALLDRLEGIVTLLVPQNGIISIPNVLAFIANLLESAMNDEHWWNRTKYSYNVHNLRNDSLEQQTEDIAAEREPSAES